MKKSKLVNLKFTLPFLLLIITANGVIAQNLPAIQQVSLRAPVTVKIDGNLAEWNDKFQAYSVIDRIFYTLANDDNKLYLTVTATDPAAIEKIINGGITLTISHTADKVMREKATDNISVKFPVVAGDKVAGIVKIPYLYQKYKPDTTANSFQIDSINYVINKNANTEFREIQVVGVKEIEDPLISIYNTEGFKAAALFDHKMVYNYELAIPLKYLSIIDKFSYNIKLSGLVKSSATVNNDKADAEFDYKNNPTDFWGEYILAK